MALRAVGVQVRARALVERARRSGRIGIRDLVCGVGDRRCQRVDRVERHELVSIAAGLRIRDVERELSRLEAEGAARCLGVTHQALALARIDPRLSADRHLLAAAHQRRIGLLRIPFVAVACPDAVGVTHEEARLDQAIVETEVLHQHRTVREIPVALGADGDVLSVRQSDPAFLRRAVGPEWRVRRVGNQPARGQRRVRRVHAAGGGELRGHAGAAATRAGDAEHTAVHVHDIHLAVLVLCERGDVQARVEPTRHRHRGLRILRDVPDEPGREVAEDVAANETRNLVPR